MVSPMSSSGDRTDFALVHAWLEGTGAATYARRGQLQRIAHPQAGSRSPRSEHLKSSRRIDPATVHPGACLCTG